MNNDPLAKLAELRPVDPRIDLTSDPTAQDILSRVLAEEHMAYSADGHGDQARIGPRFLLAAAVLVMVVGVGILLASMQQEAAEVDIAGQPSETSSNPPPDFVPEGVPVTVVSDTPTFDYRLTEDLALSWIQTTSGANQVCWRTAVDEQCSKEPQPGSTPVVIALTDDTTVVLVPYGIDGSQPTTVTVQFTNGTEVVSPIQWKPDAPYGYSIVAAARAEIQSGVAR